MLARRPDNHRRSCRRSGPINFSHQPRTSSNNPLLLIQLRLNPRRPVEHNRAARPTLPKLRPPSLKLRIVEFHKQPWHPLKDRQHSTTPEISSPKLFWANPRQFRGTSCVSIRSRRKSRDFSPHPAPGRLGCPSTAKAQTPLRGEELCSTYTSIYIYLAALLMMAVSVTCQFLRCDVDCLGLLAAVHNVDDQAGQRHRSA